MTNRRWVAPVLALVIAALLGADAGVVIARMGGDDSVAQEVPDHLKPVLAEVTAFVEQARGLKFKRPPKFALVPDDEFESLLEEDAETEVGGDDLEDQESFLGVMRALGLFDDTVDLDATAEEALDNVIGYYNFETKELYVRGVEVTPYAKEILAHELTHALDDQHFGLNHSELRDADATDAFSAFQALVEGDAVNVQLQWHASRSPEEREVIEAADLEAAGDFGDESAPDVFATAAAFPYSVGPRFVAAVRDEGGQAALDAAFRRLPTTTEQILHPPRFFAHEEAAKVPAPPAGGKVMAEGTLGELGLILVTGTAVPEADALTASAGWAGDTFRAWSEPDRTCVRWHIRMDSPGDAADLVEVLGYWAADNPGAMVTGTDPVEVTNCG